MRDQTYERIAAALCGLVACAFGVVAWTLPSDAGIYIQAQPAIMAAVYGAAAIAMLVRGGR